MGSLRNPAGWNNVFGFRPSQGRVPNWPATDVWVSALRHRRADGAQRARPRRCCSTCRPATTRACRCRSPPSRRSRRGSSERRRCRGAVRIGWLGDLDGHLAMEDGILDVCVARPGPPRGARARSSSRPRSALRPSGSGTPGSSGAGWIVYGRIAPHLADPANRARIKPEALWEHDNGARLSAADMMQASVDRSAFHLQMVTLFDRFDFLALPTAQVWPFPVEWRWPKEIAGRTMDTYHRWMEVVAPATFAGLPVRQRAGRLQRGRPADGHAADRPAARRHEAAAPGARLRTASPPTCSRSGPPSEAGGGRGGR